MTRRAARMRATFKWPLAQRCACWNRISAGSANELRIATEIGWDGWARKGVFATWTMSNG